MMRAAYVVLLLALLLTACTPSDPYSMERMGQGMQTATAQHRNDMFAASDATQAAIVAQATGTANAMSAQQTAQAWQATTQADAQAAALYALSLQSAQEAMTLARAQVAATATGMSIQATAGAVATVRADEQAMAHVAKTGRWEDRLFWLAYGVCFLVAGMFCVAVWLLVLYGRERAAVDVQARAAEVENKRRENAVYETGSGQIIDVTDPKRPRVLSDPRSAGALPSGLPTLPQVQQLARVEAEIDPETVETLDFVVDAAEAHPDGWRGKNIPGWREMKYKSGNPYSAGVWHRLNRALVELGYVDMSSGRAVISGGRTLDDIFRVMPVAAE